MFSYKETKRAISRPFLLADVALAELAALLTEAALGALAESLLADEVDRVLAEGVLLVDSLHILPHFSDRFDRCFIFTLHIHYSIFL